MENMLIGAQHPTPASGFPTIHNFFNGSMDDLVFYKGALSTEEVETVFNETPTSTIDVKTMADNIVIFPNPTSDILQINDYPSTTIKNVKIVDGSGKTVLHFLQLTDNQIDVSVLAEGIYFVVFEFQGNFITKKILKK